MKEKHIREQIQILKDQLEEQMKHTDEYADRLMESEAQELQLKKNYDKVSNILAFIIGSVFPLTFPNSWVQPPQKSKYLYGLCLHCTKRQMSLLQTERNIIILLGNSCLK